MAASAAAAAGGAEATGGRGEFIRMETYPAYGDSYKKVYQDNPPRTPQPHSQRSRPNMQGADSIPDDSKLKTVGRSIRKSITGFFLGEDDPEVTRQKWLNRCHSLHDNKVVGGKLKEPQEEDVMDGARSFDTLDNSVFAESQGDDALRMAFVGKRTPQPIDPLARSRRMDSRSSRSSHYGYGNALSRQYSHISTASSSRRSVRPAPSRRARKESVFKMAYDGIRTMGQSQSKLTRKHTGSRSFAPGSISSYHDDIESIRSPAVDSVFSPDDYINDIFFNTPNPTSPRVDLFINTRKAPLPHVPLVQAASREASNLDLPTIQERSRISEIREEIQKSEDGSAGDKSDFEDGRGLVGSDHFIDENDVPEVRPSTVRLPGEERTRPSPLTIYRPEPAPTPGVSIRVSVEPDSQEAGARVPMRGWQSGRMMPQPMPGTPDLLGLEEVESADMIDGFERIGDVIKTEFYDWDNSDRRDLGKGFVGRLFDREYKEDLSPEIQKQIEAMDEHRPFFTYWAIFIQVVIYIVAIAVYGIAPIGFEETEISGEVLKPSLAIERVSYFEKDNLWIGPRQADLIHLGAKYSPCMRADDNVIHAIESDRDAERQTACCVRNDGSGCIQSSNIACSATLSAWFNWTVETPGPEGRLSGSVCGQDPRFCNNPASSGAFVWPDNIVQWPICLEAINASVKGGNEHMTCPVVGRPCCVGIQGACIITTREYCQFRRGYFHEELTLCSQVDCMSEICGMIPFRVPEKPDQFYRLWTSLFLHAGLFQLVVTVLFQFFVMRDMEKLCGWLRTSIIYIGSGIAGSLASAIFLPYHVEAGPAGSQFGIIGCLFAELIQNFTLVQHPWRALLKQLLLLLVLFIFGLLPYVDNYAHVFGLAIGFLLAFALVPFITFNRCDKTRKLIGVVVCLLLAIGLFAFLTVLFYVIPIYSCPYCHYFNCIPFTPKFCKSMEVKIGREEIY